MILDYVKNKNKLVAKGSALSLLIIDSFLISTTTTSSFISIGSKES